MPGPVKQFVDFTVNSANDTGENTAASIQPILNGNPVDATNLSRPSESLRQRTEALKNVEVDSLFLRDADRRLIIAGPGKVTWPGSTTVAQTGIPVFSDNLYLLPMLTPGFAQAPPVPPVASAFGTLHLKRADSLNSILVTSQRRSYAAGDQISIDVVPGGAFSCTLDSVTGYQRTIHIVATGATTLATVITALTGLVPSAPDNTQLVLAALENGAVGGDLLLTSQAKQFVSGNYDGEGHTITPANVASFFTGNPTSALAEGDTLCVSFAMVSDTASTGGRRQAIPENANTAITVGAYFNSRLHPENLVNALPICKVVSGALVFATGISVAAGSVTVDLGTSTAADVSYAGGGNWADGTPNPATTVQAQLSKIVSDLASAAGSNKIAYKNPTAGTFVPLVKFQDNNAKVRSLIDHNGFPMGQYSEYDQHWRTTSTTAPEGWVLQGTSAPTIQPPSATLNQRYLELKCAAGGASTADAQTTDHLLYFDVSTGVDIMESMVETGVINTGNPVIMYMMAAVDGTLLTYSAGALLLAGNPFQYVGIVGDPNGHPNWRCRNYGTTLTVDVDSGVPIVASTVYRFRIELDAPNAVIRWFINGVLVASNAFAAGFISQALRPVFGMGATGAPVADIKFHVGRVAKRWTHLSTPDVL
jgi:hypothetical protein